MIKITKQRQIPNNDKKTHNDKTPTHIDKKTNTQ